MSQYKDFDAGIKHMDLIQVVIARLANEAALVRGWAQPWRRPSFGFAANNIRWRTAAVGLLPVVAFWWLNVYYLWSGVNIGGL